MGTDDNGLGIRGTTPRGWMRDGAGAFSSSSAFAGVPRGATGLQCPDLASCTFVFSLGSLDCSSNCILQIAAS